jgi:hypothetical protein
LFRTAAFSTAAKERVKLLVDRGVNLERTAGLPHDAAGILSTPDGALVAWFRDPDGNLLSVVQYAGL